MLRFLVHPFTRLFTLVFILGLVMLAVLGTTGIKDRISNVVFETYMKVEPRPSAEKLIFVDIDDVSLSKVGQWPWPRTKLAEVITNINKSGASVIVFDGVLAEPDRTSPDNIAKLLDDDHPAKHTLELAEGNDHILAEAIKNAGNFVAGFSYGSNEKPPLAKQNIKVKRDIRKYFLDQINYDGIYFQTTAQFLPELQQAAAGNGSFMASPEKDAVIRRTGVIFHDGKSLYPSLMLEGVRLYENDKGAIVTIKRNRDYNNFQISEPFEVSIGQYNIPVDAEGKMWVYFRDFDRDTENVSAYKFLDEYYDENVADLSGKIIFIASSAEGLMDLRATPLGNKPGVRVHMNATEQILQGKYLIRPYTANLLEVGTAAGIALVIIALSFFVNPVWLLLITVGVSSTAFWASWHLFKDYGGLFDPVTPTFMVALIFVAASVLSYLKTEYERRQVRGAFGMYVSPDVMRELEKDPSKLKLGGENKELTVMFTDIRKFTTISESLTPEELIILMNNFLTAMSDIVLEHKGTIDKYMGDAMMAFWNAPENVEEHQRQACLTALKMQSALDPLNEKIKEKAEEQGVEPVMLHAGIGLNTGMCAVGNMGSHQRFAYSALGDSVNLASRLEGQTKNYGVEILIGEETYKAVQDLAVLEMDLIRVKGKTEPVHIYALLGDEEVAQDIAFKSLKEQYDAMIAAYQSGDFETARDALMACNKMNDDRVKDVCEMYFQRIKALIAYPPEGDWDGVFDALTK